ncbi:MAG: efflux RND transporter permease subunit, partial [Fibrobacterales bacterium]|nr:efflux RND transporter permease subunit [Fibrobacterales bacterium]
MDQLIKFTIRRPIATLMMLLAVVVFGLYTYRMMSVDLLPDIDLPIVAVGIVYAGAGPEDIENTVVRPVEDQFSGLEGLKHQTVTTMENVTFFMLEFATDRDIDMAAIDIKDKLDQIRDDLPDDIETPVVYKVDLGAMPIMQIALSVPEDVSLVELRRVAEDEIGPRLARTSGVATATISGGLEREIHVEVNPAELESRSLGLQTVYGLVAASNLNYPLGSIKGRKGETTVRLDGEFATLEEIENIEIPVAGGTIRLKDVARVVDSWEDPDQRTWLNGKQTVGFSISKRSDANTVKTAAAVRKELAKLNAEFPQGWSMDIVQDNSTYIEQAVNGVFSDMLTGILLTSVLL